MWKVNWSTWHKRGTKKSFRFLLGTFFVPFTIIYSLFNTQDDFDSADPSRMQDTCHIWTQLNDLAHRKFS